MPPAGLIIGPAFTPCSLAKSRWHCRVKYVRDLIRDEKLKAFVLPNGRVRIPYESVIEYEQGHLVAAPKPPKRQRAERRPADWVDFYARRGASGGGAETPAGPAQAG